MKKKHISTEQILKVWRLHASHVAPRLIADTLGISITSTNRIIKIMTAAQNGEDVDAVAGDRNQSMSAFAKSYFGIAEEAEVEETREEVEKQSETKELECQTAVGDTTKDFMQRVLLALAWQNELLEQLLLSLGVDWKTLCKGVERR